jgi:hypothetical protein
MPAQPKHFDSLASLAAEVRELRARVAKLEQARVAKAPEPDRPFRIRTLEDPEPERDDCFAGSEQKPVPQSGFATAPWLRE